MALSTLIRRSILSSSSSSSSSLLRSYRFLSSIPSSSTSIQVYISSNAPENPRRNHLRVQDLGFRSTLFASYSSSRSYNNDDDKISPDTILFEGCDYNHWLITMEFPKDPKPTPEEMVETYVQTLAKVVGSVEEAKKRMYACSTTTYTGFQAVMTEEMSEKFRGLPGVVFILPDSYIDPVNKEYGGDKYINGTIIPRPPPVQYGRSQGRYGDRNRNYDRPRYDRQREPMQPGNQPYDRQGPPQGDGRYPQMNQRNQPYDRPGSNMQGDGRNYQAQQNYPPQQNYGPSGQVEHRNTMPSYQGNNYAQGDQGNYAPQGQGNYASQGQRNFGYAPPEQRNFGGDNRNFGLPPNGQQSWNGAGPGYEQGHTGHGGAQSFYQRDQNDGAQGDQRNYTPTDQGSNGQGRY